ncbi:UPF0481 protein [Acorus calamus]|uniref:UPF0481 protein n=1 Tax=Acorus calamus TaxID=4465 RepID=A0AAV9D1A2_ACOCL|nr:UPF0481 protein [Acorus calamus]
MEASDGENQQVYTSTTTSEPQIVIEIEKSWVDSVKSRVNGSFVPKWRKERCSIFRVPDNLRTLHPEDYEPRVVSIGPYHHGKPHLEPMEMHKWRMVRRLVLRRPEEGVLEECLRKVKALEDQARSCYSEVIDMKSNEFVEMMVLDGCFIIGILLRVRSETIQRKNENPEAMTGEEEEEEEEKDDWVWKEQKDEEEAEMGAMHSSIYLLDHVNHDLLKVENQMPFFVVEALFDLLVLQADDGPNATIYDLSMSLLKKFDPSDYNVYLNKPDKIHHLFHLYYELLAPGARKPFPSAQWNLIVGGFLKLKKKIEVLLLHVHRAIPSYLRSKRRLKKQFVTSWLKSATELQEAGVRFVKKEDSSFLDLSFKGGVMAFPVLHIYEHTMVHFRNLIAFEQCYFYTKDHITFYAAFMDFLIDTPTDVKVLQKEGILKIGISSEKEVAQFFNNLNREVYFNNNHSYLKDLIVDVNRYCDSKTHRWRAVLARDYFNNPWAVISVVAAFILLTLTLLQTFYTIYAYYHPPSP